MQRKFLRVQEGNYLRVKPIECSKLINPYMPLKKET